MPSVSALIRIGPSALDAIVCSPVEPFTAEDRLARIFVVSRIAPSLNDARLSQDAHTFLRMALGEANLQRFWADEGLKQLEQAR
jgi:hypothetical protein